MIFRKEKVVMDSVKLFPLKEHISLLEHIYAHTAEGKDKETLEEHLIKTLSYFKKIYIEKQIESIKLNLYECLEIKEAQEQALFDEMLINTFYMHDLGKININFQLKKMSNGFFKEIGEREMGHSLISAGIYIEYFLNRIKELRLPRKQQEKSLAWMMFNAYVISKHHSSLGVFSSFKGELDNLYKNYKKEGKRFRLYKGEFVIHSNLLDCLFNNIDVQMKERKQNWDNAYYYIYMKLVYSLLVACDFYATSDYMEGEAVHEIGTLKNYELWQHTYQEGETYKAIQEYKVKREAQKIDLNNVANINILRSEMFLEATESINTYQDESIFFLEAPTGSGKTNTSVQLVFNLLQKHNLSKVFYVFPFNTLVEQTQKSISAIFKSSPDLSDKIVVVNSLTPLIQKGEEEDEEKDINYNKVILDRQFFHYPFVITSHVQLFNLLFGVGREDGVAQYQLINSVIVLDEIQSYKNIIWTEIIAFLRTYSKLFNMKIIIMSATLPPLGKLLDDNKSIVSLITNRDKYFNHTLFKNRVRLEYDLLNKEDVYETLLDCVAQVIRTDTKKVLVEFIKKKTAIHFYNDLLQRLQEEGIEHELLLLTGDDSKWERERCIEKVNQENQITLIATQIIEAGVDIDMDIGFKDISLLDAEEQFIGRVNRSCKKSNSCVYFFNLDEARILYKKDYRKNEEFTLLNKDIQDILTNKDFGKYYDKILQCIEESNQQNHDHSLLFFKSNTLPALDFRAVKKHMKLIDEELYPITVFLGLQISFLQEGKEIILDGREVWRKYRDLVLDKKLKYAEKKVKLSCLREEMSCFMWKVKSCQVSYDEMIGDIYYIEQGESYIENGKFNREKISNDSYEIL